MNKRRLEKEYRTACYACYIFMVIIIALVILYAFEYAEVRNCQQELAELQPEEEFTLIGCSFSSGGVTIDYTAEECKDILERSETWEDLREESLYIEDSESVGVWYKEEDKLTEPLIIEEAEE